MKYLFRTNTFYNVLILIVFALFSGTIAIHFVDIVIPWYVPFIVLFISIFVVVYLLSDRGYFLEINNRLQQRGVLLLDITGVCSFNGYTIADCLFCVYENHIVLTDTDNVVYMDCDYRAYDMSVDLTEDSLVLIVTKYATVDTITFCADSVHLFILYKMLLRIGANFDDEVNKVLSV